MASYPEVESIITQSGRPDDGTDTEGFYSGEVLRAVAAPGRLAQGGAGDRLAAVDHGPPFGADETRARQCDE